MDIGVTILGTQAIRDNVTVSAGDVTSHATGVASQLSLALSGDPAFEFFFNVVIDEVTGGTTADLVEALTVANQKKAIGQSNSVAYNLSIRGFNSLIVRNLLADAEQLNIFSAVGAGNDHGVNLDINPEMDPLASYGRYVSGQVTVAATQRDIELTLFSNVGLRTVELAAPGVTNDALDIGDVPGTFSGTSAAAPLVAAAGAALIGKFGLTAFSARHRLTATGKHLTPLDGSVKGGRFLDMGAAFSGTISQVVGSELSFEGKAKYFAQKNPPFLQVVAVTDQPEIWFREFGGFATPTDDVYYRMNIVDGAEPGKLHGQSKETVAPVIVKLRVK